MPNEPEPGDRAPLPPAAHPRPAGSRPHWAWASAAVLIALCILTGFVVYQCSPSTQAGKLADASVRAGSAVTQDLQKLAAAIKQDNVVQTFREHLESIQPDLDGRLLVADVQATEEFAEEDSNMLGTTTSEIRVPVTYYYYVALSDPWELRVNVASNGVVTCAVLAPAVKPLPAPSIDTSHMEIQSANGWLRWDKNDVESNLLHEITPKVSARAAQKLPQFLPQARAGVEKFVKDWILKQYQLPPHAPVFINVTFLNEPVSPSKVESPPTPTFHAP
jgi:hypothetical protein